MKIKQRIKCLFGKHKFKVTGLLFNKKRERFYSLWECRVCGKNITSQGVKGI